MPNHQRSGLLLPALFLLFALPSASMAESPAALEGSWSGQFQVGQYDPMELIFHIERDGQFFSARLDIPSQHRQGIPATTVSLRGDLLRITIPDIQGEYYGALRMTRDGERIRRIDGDWSQSGEYVPLTLHPHDP